jgi:hypothetical protein
MPKYDVISPQLWNPPLLGEVLQQAHLVSETQVKEALRVQSQDRKTQGRKLGEILAERGWLKQQTADFFAQEWSNLLKQRGKKNLKPLGYYLKAAALLNDEQINMILAEQGQGRLWIRLGAAAVLKGWLKQSTVDFFVEHLFPEYAVDSPFLKVRKKSNN